MKVEGASVKTEADRARRGEEEEGRSETFGISWPRKIKRRMTAQDEKEEIRAPTIEQARRISLNEYSTVARH